MYACALKQYTVQNLLLFFLLMVLLAAAAHAHAATADDGSAAIPGPTVLIYFENDLFYNEDRYYTNAVQVRVLSPDLASLAENGYLPDGISNLLVDVPFPGNKDATRYNLSLGFGQQIYTPKDTNVRTLQEGDGHTRAICTASLPCTPNG